MKPSPVLLAISALFFGGCSVPTFRPAIVEDTIDVSNKMIGVTLIVTPVDGSDRHYTIPYGSLPVTVRLKRRKGDASTLTAVGVDVHGKRLGTATRSPQELVFDGKYFERPSHYLWEVTTLDKDVEPIVRP